MPIARSALEGSVSNVQQAFFDFTAASVESPLSINGQWARAPNSAYSAMQIANGAGGQRACYGYNVATSTSDAVALLAGSNWLPNQKVTVTFYKNGTTGVSELEIHLNSYGDASNHFLYEFDILGMSVVQLAKWCGSLGTVVVIGNNATSAAIVTGDTMTCEVTGPASARRLTCKFTPLATGIEETVLDFTDDGSATWGSIPPLKQGAPGLGGDDAGPTDNGGNDYSLNLGFKTFLAVTTPLG